MRPASAASLIAALALATPILVVLAHLALPGSEASAHVLGRLAPRYALGSATLALGAAGVATVVGVGTAWLVVMCRFPARRFHEAALVLPLAAPAYVLAYVYYDALSVAGPAQRALRSWTGWSARDYWFPDIASMGGAIFVLSIALYPYVFLLARAAFLRQSGSTIDVCRMLGCSPTRAFFTVMLPLARPAITVGAALVAMEALADYGAVSILGVQTFTTGVYRAWFSLGDRIAATQLACALLGFAALALALERWGRRHARHHVSDLRPNTQFELTGARAWAASLACALPWLLGFALPILALLRLAFSPSAHFDPSDYLSALRASVLVGAIAAVAATTIALAIGAALWARPGPVIGLAARVAGLGYAAPGPVIAIGVLITLAAIDRQLAALSAGALGPLILQGGLIGLIFAYLARFAAVSLGAIESGFAKIKPSVDAAAVNLGVGLSRRLVTVHGPLLAPSIAVALAVTFVDVVKELPATLVLRPFDFDTLAVRVFDLVRDERLAEAAPAALTLIAVGAAPALTIARRLARE